MRYATLQDIIDLWRPLTAEEQTRAEALIDVVCDSLRYEAEKVGKDLDKEIEASPTLLSVARSVTVDVIARTLMTSTDQEPMTQFSQSANGYSISGSFLAPGGGLFIKRSELARLGLRRQKIGCINTW